jgi:uncharacterized protein YndB with AHSA1/START domain
MPTTTPNLHDRERPRADAAERVLALSVVFDVSRTHMFELWTRPEHRRHWYMPRDMHIEVLEDDIHVGGRFRVILRDHEGKAHGLRGEYRELVVPERIVFTHCWDDTPDHQTTVTVLLTAEGPERTRVTLHHGVFPSRDARDRHVEGWQSTFENLAEYASRARG